MSYYVGGRFRRETPSLYKAQLRNLKKARAAKKMYSKVGTHLVKRSVRGGFAPLIPAILGTASAVHGALQKVRPISGLRTLGTALGVRLPDNAFTKGLSKVGDFLVNKLGYGMRRKKYRHRKRYY